ncbi:MATE family efflux transporter [Achromobacter xylosoxidans]|uniref:MATE family efflux transporter n=1 Tax=Alcaligenes xylosoxydans xylosoxydans TaxID=85698 RepID=UPI0012AA995F|nr:MATE family efflux transporter [Achromobacter xylosoxidans]CUR82148.1 multidrug efflux pump VmrA [Achromobacter xylosoxidans]
MTAAAAVPARFVSGPLRGHVLEMVLTGWASMLAVFAVEFLTLLYLGTLRDEAVLAAVGFGSMTLFTITSICIGVTVGGAAQVSRALGAGDAPSARRLAAASLVLMVAATVMAVAVFLLAIGPFTRAIGLAPDVRALVLSYVAITAPFSVVMGLGMMLSNLLRAAGHGRQSMWVLLAGIATVAVLDPVVIFVFEGGMPGVAWAGGAGRAATVALGAWLVFRRHRLVARPARHDLRADLAAVGGIALPAALSALATPAAVVFTASTYAGFGSSTMAGATVVDRVLQLSYSLFFVLPGAIGPILGQNLGAGHWQRVRQTVGFTARMALAYGAGVAILLAALAPWIADVFQVSGPGRELVMVFCRYASFIWALNSIFFVSVAVFNNLGYAAYATAVGWLRATVGTLPFVWLGARYGGAEGVLLGQTIGFALSSLLALMLCLRVLRRPPPDLATLRRAA